MYCKFCGKEMSEKALVCLNCGKFVSKEAEITYLKNRNEVQKNVQSNTQENKTENLDVKQESVETIKEPMKMLTLFSFICGILSFLTVYVEYARIYMSRQEYIFLNALSILIMLFSAVCSCIILSKYKQKKIDCIFSIITLGLLFVNLLLKLITIGQVLQVC